MHRLNIEPKYQPIRQKKRNFVLEYQKAIEEDMDKLLNISFIQEVKYP